MKELAQLPTPTIATRTLPSSTRLVEADEPLDPEAPLVLLMREVVLLGSGRGGQE
jgi:hypothetical protein